MNKIKKKDIVLVISGKDKGKKGEVLKVLGEEGKLVVSKINVAKKHFKPRQNEPGGIKEIEQAIQACNVMVVCPKCSRPTRVAIKDLPSENKKIRICKKCGEMML